MEMLSFLNQIGLSEYQQLFEEHEINLDILKDVELAELDDIGIRKLGHRHIIMREVNKLDMSFKENLALTWRQPPKKAQKLTPEINVELVSFFEDIGLPEYKKVFEEQAITLDILKELNATQLEGIGIKKLGHRKQIMRKIKNISDTPDKDCFDLTCTEPPREELKMTTECKPQSSTHLEDTSRVLAYAQSAQLIDKISKLKKRSKTELLKTYSEMLTFEDKLSEQLKQEMKPEFGDTKKFILEKIKDVEDDTCQILITGETSAGKSSFVNLLLGESILPQSCLSCTSTICRIHNSKSKSIVSTDFDGKCEELFEESFAWPEDVQNFLLTKVASEGRGYKYIDIYWPIKCLKENITIVDAPGIDPDDPKMTDRIYEYIPNALVFIYIINPTNNGGVQSDRLLKLKDEMKKRIEGKGVSMDFNKAIFICNKWDQVCENPNMVLQVIQTRLEKSWQGFNKDQLFTLSTKLEIMNAKKREDISPDYCNILLAIEKIIPSTVEEKLVRHLQWQRVFTNRVLKCVSSRILQDTMLSEIEKSKKVKDILDSIDSLEAALPEVEQKILANSKQMLPQIIKDIISYLKNPSNQDQIFCWSTANLPEANDKFEKLLEDIIYEHINKAIRQRLSIEMENFLNVLNYNLMKECSKLCSNFQEMEELISGPIARLYHEWDLTGFSTDIKNEDIMVASAVTAVAIGAPIAAFKEEFDAKLICLSFVFPLTICAYIVYSSMQKFKEYKQDKVKYAQNLAIKILNDLTEDGLMEITKPIIQTNEQHIKEFIANAFTQRLNGVKVQVKNLTNSRVNSQDICTQSYSIQQEALAILGRNILSKMVIFEKDVLQNLDREKMGINAKDPNLSQKEETWILASSGSFLYDCGSKQGCIELAEICSLRAIEHKNILKIYRIKQLSIQGISRWHILQEACETSLEHEVLENNMEWTNCLHYLRDCAEGLLFLHEMCWIHKNIRLLNIKIKEKTGKLSDGVVTQYTPLTGNINGIPIITAPEILKKSGKGPEVDIFNFGIVMWEAWYRKHAFCMPSDQQQINTYDKLSSAIIDGVRPKFHERIPDEKMIILIEKCWANLPEERPTCKELLQIMINLIEVK